MSLSASRSLKPARLDAVSASFSHHLPQTRAPSAFCHFLCYKPNTWYFLTAATNLLAIPLIMDYLSFPHLCHFPTGLLSYFFQCFPAADLPSHLKKGGDSCKKSTYYSQCNHLGRQAEMSSLFVFSI